MPVADVAAVDLVAVDVRTDLAPSVKAYMPSMCLRMFHRKALNQLGYCWGAAISRGSQ